ncbi:unnamed protein product [Adineta steineri]|uniref:Uncharacterized protein n=1 Tax=Adineta steineri TaxID=433720 RepID=A0A815IUU8_9BILA|nr:unnamed protein product [Adineta steineri]CAF3941223.1 unnamed protein product [Adineta steineri]
MKSVHWHTLHINQGIASFAQERIFLDEQMRFSNKIAIYNELTALKIIQGSISIDRLLEAIEYILNKHKISKTRATVNNPTIARLLLPYNHLFGIRRPCSGTDYYETFNRNNITLVDLRNKTYEIDDIVLALGFDAFTSALLNIDIHGRSGKPLREKWKKGWRTYLGLMIADFPNLFTISGSDAPSDLANMVSHIEQHVKWITKCLEYLRTDHINIIEPTLDSENTWVKHVNDVVEDTLF